MINALFEMLIRRSRLTPEPSDSSSSGGSGIPTDYMWYVPLSGDYSDHSTYARTMSYNTTAPTFTVNDGVPCAELAANTGIYTLDSTGITTGNVSRTLSGWVKLTSTAGSYPSVLFTGYGATRQTVHLTYTNGKMEGVSWGFETNPRFTLDLFWHHYLIRYDSSNNAFDFFVDGTRISSSTVSGGISFPASGSKLGIACTPTSSDKVPYKSYYAGVRMYERAVTDEEVALLAAEFTPWSNIIFEAQLFTLIDGIQMTGQLSATPSGCTFSTEDTLPAGVTLSSSGVLSYDGTAISQSSTVPVTVTASKTGYNSTSATMTLNMTAASEGPTDYVFRAPLTADINDVSATARTGTETGGSVTVGTIKNGITCTYIPQSVRLLWPKGDVVVGSDPRTFCTWIHPSFSTSSWRTVMGMGQELQYQVFGMGYRTSSNYAACGTYYNDLETSTPLINGWNHMAMVWDGSYIRLYLNGVEIGTKSGSSTTVNTASSDIALAGRSFNTGDLCENAWFADARIYNRALSASAVAALATHIN